MMVLMTEQGISLEDIRKELAKRHIIDHKVKAGEDDKMRFRT